MYWSSDVLDSDYRPSLRLKPTNSNAAEYVTYPKDSYNRLEPGFTLGGPIMKDKVWFFAGYNPEFRPYDRTAPLSRRDPGHGDAEADGPVLHRERNGAVRPQLRARAAFNLSDYRQEGRLPTQDGTSSPTRELRHQRRPAELPRPR